MRSGIWSRPTSTPMGEAASVGEGRSALFLVHCGYDRGLGHLRRMLVLAGAFRDEGFRCTFGVTEMGRAAMVTAGGHTCVPWHWSDAGVVDGFDLVVLDGYDHPTELAAEWRGRLFRVLMDDVADRPQEAEVLVNHNLYGERCDYRAYAFQRALCGPRYTIVGPAFVRLRSVGRDTPPGVLVSFGSTDRGGFGEAMARALVTHASGVRVEVAFMDAPQEVVDRLEAMGVLVHLGRALEEVMGGCSVLVGAAGSTVTEALTAGLRVVGCGIAPDQRLYAETGRAFGLEMFEAFDPLAMAAAALVGLHDDETAGVDLIDGLGAGRIVWEVSSMLKGYTTRTRVHRERYDRGL